MVIIEVRSFVEVVVTESFIVPAPFSPSVVCSLHQVELVWAFHLAAALKLTDWVLPAVSSTGVPSFQLCPVMPVWLPLSLSSSLHDAKLIAANKHRKKLK